MRQRSVVWLGCGVLALAAAASAQRRPVEGSRPNPGGRGNVAVIDRVLSDLDRSRSFVYTDRHERRHFDHAREDLIRFKQNWSRGQFEKGRLDGAIDNLNHLASADRVNPRERRIFYSDAEELRAFRARSGTYIAANHHRRFPWVW